MKSFKQGIQPRFQENHFSKLKNGDLSLPFLTLDTTEQSHVFILPRITEQHPGIADLTAPQPSRRVESRRA